MFSFGPLMTGWFLLTVPFVVIGTWQILSDFIRFSPLGPTGTSDLSNWLIPRYPKHDHTDDHMPDEKRRSCHIFEVQPAACGAAVADGLVRGQHWNSCAACLQVFFWAETCGKREIQNSTKQDLSSCGGFSINGATQKNHQPFSKMGFFPYRPAIGVPPWNQLRKVNPRRGKIRLEHFNQRGLMRMHDRHQMTINDNKWHQVT